CPSALPYTTLFRSPISLSTTHFSKRAPIKGSWEIMLPADCSGLVHPGQGTIPVRLFQVGHLIAIRESLKVLLEILCGRGGFLLGDGARHLQLIALEFSVVALGQEHQVPSHGRAENLGQFTDLEAAHLLFELGEEVAREEALQIPAILLFRTFGNVPRFI